MKGKSRAKKRKKVVKRRHSKPSKGALAKQKPVPRPPSLDDSFSALLQWSQQVHGLTANVRRAAEAFQGSLKLKGARLCIAAMQNRRPILEELYLWKCESAGHLAQQEPEKMKAQLEEGAVLVEALFDILAQDFQIRIMHEPGEKITTPKRGGRDYKFQEKFKDGMVYSRVVFPGLRQEKAVISPCEIAQSE